MSYNNMGVFDGGIITPKQTQPVGMPVMDAAGIASGNAFLTSELEKRDPIIRQPLTSGGFCFCLVCAIWCNRW